MRRLIEIQQKLKAPKNQRNNFGNYNYRNAEDILEAVKPLLKEQELALILNDEIINIENRFYVKSTVTIFDTDGKPVASSSALAREEECKKGMDGSQVTGASSSYARKYALNGLFAIDDTKDSDFTNTGNTEPKKPAKKEKTIADEDIDIFEGLKACDTTANAEKYKDRFKGQVKDIEAFRNLYTQVYRKLKKEEDWKKFKEQKNVG